MPRKYTKVDPNSVKKKGALSTEEMTFINNSKEGMSVEDMANALNRHTEPITNYINKMKVKRGDISHLSEQEQEDIRLKDKLHQKFYWPEIVRQFSKIDDDNELHHFENMWVALMKQFKEDVLETEESEIKHWITLDILANRMMVERNASILEIEQLEKELKSEYKLDKASRDKDRIQSLEMQITTKRSEVNDLFKNRGTVLDKVKDIRKDFKMARSDRIKKIEDGKLDWVGLIRSLEEADAREKAGLEAEIIARASEKKKKELMQQHQYTDGQWDSPLLNADTEDMLDRQKLEQETKNQEQGEISDGETEE